MSFFLQANSPLTPSSQPPAPTHSPNNSETNSPACNIRSPTTDPIYLHQDVLSNHHCVTGDTAAIYVTTGNGLFYGNWPPTDAGSAHRVKGWTPTRHCVPFLWNQSTLHSSLWQRRGSHLHNPTLCQRWGYSPLWKSQ